VQIPVIATGFRHQEMPQRRERMLAEATLPTMRYDVPIQPRVVTSRPAASRFASETPESEPESEGNAAVVPVQQMRQEESSVEPGASPELIPVPASVFDDDFFRSSAARAEAAAEFDRGEGAMPDRFREPTHFTPVHRVQPESGGAEEMVGAEPVGRGVSFGGPVSAPTAHAESDELDIPAFLRRGN
jgi:cell division protein FtsZ